LEDVSYRDLARELGMDHKTISAAVRGRTWSHVT
jgi:plasmid maintenance system antidote protein VapI